MRSTSSPHGTVSTAPSGTSSSSRGSSGISNRGATSLTRLSECLADKTIEPRQVLPTLNAILVDKYHYACRSRNLAESFEDFDSLDPDGGDVARGGHGRRLLPSRARRGRRQSEEPRSLGGRAQPEEKRAGHRLSPVPLTRRRETRSTTTAISLLVALMEGGKAKTPAVLTKGKFVFKKQAPRGAARPRARPAQGAGTSREGCRSPGLQRGCRCGARRRACPRIPRQRLPRRPWRPPRPPQPLLPRRARRRR